MDHKNEEADKCVESERNVIAEGKAKILLSSAGHVFYNPVQEFNRDLRCIWACVVALGHRTGQTNFLSNLAASLNTLVPL
jgi:tRNA G26 N,N-dimethylase Trm1